MIAFIFALLLLLLALTAIVMRKTYDSIPAKELKRRAAKGDQRYQQLYLAVAYGGALDLLLWAIVALTSAGGFILLTKVAPNWISFLAVVLLLFVFYSLVPATRITAVGSRVTLILTPLLARVLSFLHPVLGRGAKQIQKRRTSRDHTGLYERADLLELINKQLSQPDSRFSNVELMIVSKALSFNDSTVHNIITPWKAVKTISVNDIVGPVVIDEAHRSGLPLIPVVEGKGADSRVVGTLRVAQLGLNSDGQAADLMDQAVYYLHEDDSLTEALHAFYVTNQPLFVVLDSTGKYVGIITMAAMLQKLLGELPGAGAEEYTEYTEIKNRNGDKVQNDNAEVISKDSEPQLNNTEKTATSDETVIE
jgi:CBS domain containing-hemolysin-like protein